MVVANEGWRTKLAPYAVRAEGSSAARADEGWDVVVPHYKSLLDGSYLGSWDFPPGAEAVVVIESVSRFVPEQKRRKRCPDCKGSKTVDQKPCTKCRATGYVDEKNKRLEIRFRRKRKAWLAGPVSLEAIAKMYGTDTDKWIGKSLALYVDPDVEFGGKRTGGVRCRPTPPKPGTTPTEDPLDRPVDEDKARELDEAAGRAAGDGS